MGFAGYFLIVSDFIKWAKNKNIPVGPGRGSGAGSLVAWALSITDLDPIKYGLIFERNFSARVLRSLLITVPSSLFLLFLFGRIKRRFFLFLDYLK